MSLLMLKLSWRSTLPTPHELGPVSGLPTFFLGNIASTLRHHSKPTSSQFDEKTLDRLKSRLSVTFLNDDQVLTYLRLGGQRWRGYLNRISRQ